MKNSSGHESRRESRPHDIILDLSPRPDSYSYSNRRTAITRVQRLYPLLLFASTAIAAVFCFAYITKPVVATYSSGPETSGNSNLTTASPVNPITNQQSPSNNLPGLNTKKQPSNTKPTPPPAPLSAGFEETNIRMQHILDAESTSGDIHRIIIDVPALYKSRNLRWSQDDAAQARVLLKRLEQFQEKSRSLREEGNMILEDWNKLMDASVPNQVLRADSPSLSANLLKSNSITRTPDSKAVKIQSDKESP